MKKYSKILSGTIVCIFGLTYISVSAHGAVCDWAKKTPADTSEYKYFVARAFSDKSRSDAMRRAEDDITQQVCNILGTYVSTASDSYESESVSDSTSSSAQRSRCLGIYKQNFEKIETDDGRVEGEYVACIKYRYAKANMRQEQQRINKEGTAAGSLALNEYVGQIECAGHPLQVKSTPAGAYVSIDDLPEYSGVTPLRFGNVCNGSHKMTITLPHYNTVTKSIGTKTKEVHEKMVRSTVPVKISTNIGKSTITVNDSDGFKLKSGSEPLTYKFLSGVKYSIAASNPGANTVTTTNTFDKNSDKSLEIKMSYLPGAIDFTVFKKRNPGVKIYVDGTQVKKDKTGQLKPNERYSIRFTKAGYHDIKDSVYIKPKQTVAYKSDVLDFKTDEFFFTKYETLNEPSWLWLGAGYNTAIYSANGLTMPLRSVGLTGHAFMGRYFSFDASISFGRNSFETSYGDSAWRDSIGNSGAANLFPNYDMYARFGVKQSYTNIYAGLSWYPRPRFLLSPFLSIGYGQFLPISYKVIDLDSNFMTDNDVRGISEFNSGYVAASAGVQFLGVFRLTGTYSSIYRGVSMGIVVPYQF